MALSLFNTTVLEEQSGNAGTRLVLQAGNGAPAPSAVQVLELDDDLEATADIVFNAQPHDGLFGQSLTSFCDVAQGDDFFEEIYVLPRKISAGVILSDQVYTIDVYNAYRQTAQTWSAYDDSSLGNDVDLTTPQPPPDIVLQPQTGQVRTLTIGLSGPPSINGTMDFTFTGLGLFQITVTGTRTVLFAFEPEVPLREKLMFLTDVLEHQDGTEQRSRLRDKPRQIFEMRMLTDGNDRTLLDHLLFNNQDGFFGVPVWFEAVELTSAVAINDTVINVEDTTLSDYRVGGLMVIWNDPFNFEAQQIQSLTATTITVSSPFTMAFDQGSRVMPVVTCITGNSVRQGRYRVNLQDNTIKLECTDNVNLSDTTGFTLYDGKLLLDQPNWISGQQVPESWNRKMRRIDSETGTISNRTTRPTSRKGSAKGFVTTNRTDLWTLRKLLHALGGRHTSFWLPTFHEDLEPVANILTGDGAIDVSAVSYSDSVQSRAGRNVIRIILKDGTKSDPKLITGVSSPSAGVERLSIAPDTAGVTASIADIERIEFVEKVRFDSDVPELRHFDALGSAQVGIPVKVVLEGNDP